MTRLEALLDDLMTNGMGLQCNRLVLMLDRQDMGGWSREALARRILRHAPELAAEIKTEDQ